MALLKDVMQPTGVVVGYWVITSCQSYFDDKLGDVTLFGYVAADARMVDPVLAPITTRLIRIPVDPVINPPEMVSDIRVPLYEALEAWLADNPDDPLHGATNDGMVP